MVETLLGYLKDRWLIVVIFLCVASIVAIFNFLAAKKEKKALKNTTITEKISKS
jgi:hypothetical protein